MMESRDASDEMSVTSDYAALVKLLLVLTRLPDAVGDTILTPGEATTICALGFQAKPGRWRVPPLPPQLTNGNPLLEPLSVGWENRPMLPEIPRKADWAHPHKGSAEASKERAKPKPSAEAVHSSCHETEQSVPRADAVEEKLVQELVTKMRDRAIRSVKPMRKRRWQQLYWRYPAKIFNRAFRILVGTRLILLENN